MLFHTLDTGKNQYKLRLDAKHSRDVERQLGCSLLGLFGGGNLQDLPDTETIVIVLHGALQKYHHGISIDDTFEIFDEYIENGKTYVEMFEELVEVLKVSGFFKLPKTQEKTDKK